MDNTHELPAHSENVDEELVRIHLALDAVFSAHASSDTHWWANRQLADRYLTTFQVNPVSWMVCDRLLQSSDGASPSTLQQRRFFAAQTLHTKCRADMFQLPSESLPSLRDSLLQHLQRYAMADDPALTTRLAMCIAVLAVQMNWCTIVTDLVRGNHPVHYVMPILRVLPEECASERLRTVDENYRLVMRDHLVATAPTFFQYLQVTMSHEPISVLKTFHAWIRFVPVRPLALCETPLLEASVRALTHSEYLEYAADVVVEVLRMYPSHQYGNERLVEVLIPLLSQLPFDTALRSDDEDVLRAYCRVVTEMGESYLSLILSENHVQSSQLVSWVLLCSSMPDTEIAAITLHFWYRFVMDLDGVAPYDSRQELIDYYSPYLLQLMDVCVSTLMRYPSDVADMPEDMIEDIQRHRFYVGETIEDCCRLLGGHIVLQRLGMMLRQEIQHVSGRQMTVWQGIESSLSCICAIHRFVPSDESEVLPFCFQLILELPSDIRPLRDTACRMIGKFASWLALRSNLLPNLMQYLAQSLYEPDCATSAAVAIKEICECSTQNFGIAEPVVKLYEDCVHHHPRLALLDELQVLEGACRAISRQIYDTNSDGSQYITRIANPMISRLAESLSDATSRPRRVIPDIERLTVVFQYLKAPRGSTAIHPMVELLKSCWVVLESATNRFLTDNQLAEKICRLHKHVLRSCGAQAYAPMLSNLMQFLVSSFDRSHQSPFLYAASICVTEYGPDPSYSAQLYEMVAALAGTTFSFLRNLQDMTNHPDVVEEFFYLLGRVVNHTPDPLVLSPLLQAMIQCAIVGMQLDHEGANKGTLRFIEDAVSYALALREMNKPQSMAALEGILSMEGQSLVVNLCRALVGDLAVYSERQIPEIMWKLHLLYPQQLTNWLTTAFHGVERVSERGTADFLAALNDELTRDEFTLVVHAFQRTCQREYRFRTN